MTEPQDEGTRGEAGWGEALSYPLACAGAMVGAAVGAGVCKVAAGAGFYAIIAVGVLAGFGASLAAQRRGVAIGVIAAVVAIVASLLTEGWFFPFVADDSLGYFVAHIGDLRPFTLLMHAVGAGAAFFIAWRK